jgi:plastocyanin
MKKVIITGVLVVVALVVGGSVWFWLGSSHRKVEVNQDSTDQRADLTVEKSVAIKIRDLSFTPPNIKIKKGTKVTWTNEDTIGHNVLADDPTNTGGLPTDRPLLGRTDTFSHTFQTVGTFRYHCGAHSFMRGSVEVVE